jgi:hypothetical protein
MDEQWTGRQVIEYVSWAVPLHTMEGQGGEELQLLLILDLGTRWGWVVSVTTPTALYPRENDSR